MTAPVASPIKAGYALSPRPTMRKSIKQRAGGQCGHKAPCGKRCTMAMGIRHRFHSCDDEGCQSCHGPARFGRAAK